VSGLIEKNATRFAAANRSHIVRSLVVYILQCIIYIRFIEGNPVSRSRRRISDGGHGQQQK